MHSMGGEEGRAWHVWELPVGSLQLNKREVSTMMNCSHTIHALYIHLSQPECLACELHLTV